MPNTSDKLIAMGKNVVMGLTIALTPNNASCTVCSSMTNLDQVNIAKKSKAISSSKSLMWSLT